MTDLSDSAATVLVVEANPDEREMFGAWLEDAGYRVLASPGPLEPDFTCVGDRTGTCPLATAASVVVLDMSTQSEMVGFGTASEDLLGLYLFADRRVVALGSRPGGEIPDQLLRRQRHPEWEELLDAVRSLMHPGDRPICREERHFARPE
ncbi:MAG TPA: hypothetical protein VFA08_08675 [Actinomycetota bacterium]|jgi:hypothetical protein|nr:hypothetical protein [Actinomycetota bacterium]